MPYELSFTKRVPIVDREQYINECCIGGDVVVNRLLPSVRSRYTDVQTNQEDWGWFIWFRQGERETRNRRRLRMIRMRGRFGST